MARRIRVSGGVLNVRLHPHPDRTYATFIERIYGLRQAIRVRGDRHAMLSLLNRSEQDDGIYTGLITTFTKIDTSEPWFDASELKEASNNQVSEVSIPENLYPNAATFNFLFDTKAHRFYIQTYSKEKNFSVNSVLTLLDKLADSLSITRDFGSTKITIVQSKVGLENVFSLPVIKRVIITIDKPNADIFDDDFDENVEEYLEQLHSRRLTLVLEAEGGKSIQPTAELRRLGQSALENGSVRTEGRDQNGTTKRSTEDFPRPLHDRYDPDEVTEKVAFRRLTGK